VAPNRYELPLDDSPKGLVDDYEDTSIQATPLKKEPQEVEIIKPLKE
jgi:hypothetical protein